MGPRLWQHSGHLSDANRAMGQGRDRVAIHIKGDFLKAFTRANHDALALRRDTGQGLQARMRGQNTDQQGEICRAHCEHGIIFRVLTQAWEVGGAPYRAAVPLMLLYVTAHEKTPP